MKTKAIDLNEEESSPLEEKTTETTRHYILQVNLITLIKLGILFYATTVSARPSEIDINTSISRGNHSASDHLDFCPLEPPQFPENVPSEMTNSQHIKNSDKIMQALKKIVAGDSRELEILLKEGMSPNSQLMFMEFGARFESLLWYTITKDCIAGTALLIKYGVNIFFMPNPFASESCVYRYAFTLNRQNKISDKHFELIKNAQNNLAKKEQFVVSPPVTK